MLNLIPKAWARYIYEDVPPAVEPNYCENLDWNEAVELRALMCIFNRIYNLVIYTIGAVFIIWMIISGIRYLTAGSDEDAVASAKQSLTYAVFGFLIVIAAHAAIVMVGNLLGIGIPIFRIPAAAN
jgi:hypothetical protein